MRNAIHNLLGEPKAPDAPRQNRLDYAIAAVLGVASAIEASIVDDIAWRSVSVVLALVVALPLIWRRNHPLGAVVVAFGLQAGVETLAVFSTDKSTLAITTVFAGLVLTYSLCRWASGRAAVAGLTLIVATHLWTELINPAVEAEDAIVGVTTWMFPAAFALAMRYRARARVRAVFDAQMMERNRLARELHDTVAHHITAITVQAQAAQLLAKTNADRAVEILATIEQESTAAVEEMQQIVQVLRHPTEGAPTGPQPKLRDIAGLGDLPGAMAVDVALEGDLDALSPTVEASLFRVAQEAITNARRHARHATKVSVQVTSTNEEVKMLVHDDGEPPVSQPLVNGSGGQGLIGMEERIALLGGTFNAAPGREGGWVVTAVLPRTDARS